MRDQSQTLIEVKPCHARKLKISAESRQRGLSRICLPFITALIAFSLARVRSISAVHSWAFRLILVYAIAVFALDAVWITWTSYYHTLDAAIPTSNQDAGASIFFKRPLLWCKRAQVRDLCWSCLRSEDRERRLV